MNFLKRNVKLRLTEKIPVENELKNKIKDLPLDRIPIIIAGGSFNSQNNQTIAYEQEVEILRNLVKNINPKKAFFVIGHKLEGYEKEILDLCKKFNNKIDVYAIIPNMVEKDVMERLKQSNIVGIRPAIDSDDFGIYKSFNYEIFERRDSVLIALDGNSPVYNLIQEAKNGKGKARIYINNKNKNLRNKADTLEGYVTVFELEDEIWKKILEDKPEIKK